MSSDEEKAYARQWRRDHPDKSKAYWDRFHASHPEANRVAVDKWQAAHPDEVRANWRKQATKNYLKKRLARFGVTPEWFRDQLVGQAGRCAICGNVMNPGRDTHVDHDHVTGRVRALLCANCNLMLGHAKDSASTLQSAITYLEG